MGRSFNGGGYLSAWRGRGSGRMQSDSLRRIGAAIAGDVGRAVLMAAVLVACILGTANAGQIGPTCPPGQTTRGYSDLDGKTIWTCVNVGETRMPADPPAVGQAMSCNRDEDCPGASRCEWASSYQSGTCGRTNAWCNSDAECKYSEFCDTTKSDPVFKGACAPRGGHYPN